MLDSILKSPITLPAIITVASVVIFYVLTPKGGPTDRKDLKEEKEAAKKGEEE